MTMHETMAAFTSDDYELPEFISIHDLGGDVHVTLRGRKVRDVARGCNLPGPLAGIKMSWDEWDKFVSDINGYRRSV